MHYTCVAGTHAQLHAYIDPDLFWHSLSLVGEGHSIAVASALIAGQLAEFKLLLALHSWGQTKEGGDGQ